MSSESIQCDVVDTELGVVYLIGEIDEELCAKVVLGLAQCVKHESIRIFISSEGGDLWYGMAISDAIRSMRVAGTEVTGEVFGHCFSAATFPLLACSTRLMAKSAWLGIHGMQSGMHGDMKDMEAEHAFNKRLAAQQAEWYAQGSKHDVAYWEPFLREKTTRYYSADEALVEGLIDAVS